MLGHKLKELREAKGLLQREIAARLDVDTAYISKVENNEKRLSKNHLFILSKLFGVRECELHKLWLADKVLSMIEEDEQAEQAIMIVHDLLIKSKKKC
jgi:transcriptional regulator with XRE-family HTH domain